MTSPGTSLTYGQARVNQLVERYLETVFRVDLWLNDALEWVASLEDEDEKLIPLTERLRAYELGVNPPPPDGEDLIEVSLTLDEVAELRSAMERTRTARSQYREMLAEMAVVHTVASFEAFLSDLLIHVLVARPEMLKRSSKSVSYETVIEAGSRDDLVVQLAEREVGSWMYKSFRDQAVVLDRQFGIDLSGADDVSVESVVETYARRNVLLHNAGIMDENYVRLAGKDMANVGERVTTDGIYWRDKATEMTNSVRYLAWRVCERFFAGGVANDASGPSGT